MELFGLDISVFISVVGAISFSLILLVALYVLRIKPSREKPLPNEKYLGLWTIQLPGGLGVRVGHVTTAYKTVVGWLNKIVESETEEALKKSLLTVQNLFSKFYFVAQKVGRQVHIYLFDENPEDQKFLDVDPAQDDSYILGRGIQDAITVGEWNGFQFTGVKLDPSTKQLSSDERQKFEVVLEISKYVRDAARNTERIRYIRDERDDARLAFEKEVKDKAKIRSECDRAVSALGQKPLTQPEGVKVPGAWKAKVKEWFANPWQIAVALLFYFVVSPLLQSSLCSQFGWDLQPPMSHVFGAFIAVVGFFAIPFARKIFGRWL